MSENTETPKPADVAGRLDGLVRFFRNFYCSHKNKKRMTIGDYWKHARQPDRYVLTICLDCDRILHGYWMDKNA